MNRRPPPWSEKFHVEWTALAQAQLSVLGIDEAKYRGRTIKERLMDSMAVPNIVALVDHAKDREGNDDVWNRLVIHRSTPNRWLKDEHQPHAREFFGLLVIGLRKELSEVQLPSIRRVLWEGVARTIAIIREKECQLPRSRLNWEDFAIVRLFHTHPNSDCLLREPAGPAVHDACQDVADELRRRYPHRRSWTQGAVLRSVGDWAFPYALFRLGLLNEWTFLDDEASRHVH